MAQEGTKRKTVPEAYPRTYTLQIFRSANGKFKVRPGTLVVEVGDTLEWESLETGATVMFPPVHGDDIVSRNRIPIAEGEKEHAVVRRVRGGKTSKFNDIEVPYAVHCIETNDFAEGGSDPKIIVKGP